MTIRRAALLAPFVLAALLAGCSSGKRDPGTPPTGGSNPPPPAIPTGPGTGATVTYAVVAPAATSEVIGGVNQVLALIFTLEATGGDVDLYQITLDSVGTLANDVFGQAIICADANPPNGVLDPAEFTAPVAAAAPAMTSNPDAFTISFGATPARVLAGTPATFFVLLDPTGVAPGDRAVVGQTVEVGLAAASDLDVRDTNNNALTATAAAGTTIGPAPYATSRVTVGIHPHLLISEVVASGGTGTGSDGEYVEIYNPSGATVDLTNYYLTDFIDPDSAAAGVAYYNLPSGTAFDPRTVNATVANHEFLVRFPAGAQIAPGQVITVAVLGAAFAALYNVNADYFLASPPTPLVGQQMLTWNGVATAGPPPTPPVFTAADDAATIADNGGDMLLFFWDQQSDLVVDIDLVNYGAGFSGQNSGLNKGQMGTPPAPIAVDGPDADTTPTAYKDETDVIDQNDPAKRAPAGVVIKRIDFTEGAEVRQNGNGSFGHDETSEDFNNTFTGSAAATATPGSIP